MVKRSFALTIEGKVYQVEILRQGVIAVNGNVFNVQVAGKEVRVNDESVAASLSEEFAIVGGRLYDVEWTVD